MNNYVLFVFEGAKTEPNIVANFSNFFINEDNRQVVKACYGANIYKLYEEINKDSYLDIYELLVEQVKDNSTHACHKDILQISSSEEISDIYLFFDYDGHCTNADDEKLQEMVKYFDDSQDNGFLVISYPMVESIRQISPQGYTYETCLVDENLSLYKKWLNKQIAQGIYCSSFQNWGLYTLKEWSTVININLQRINTLADTSEPPISSVKILENQIAKHLNKDTKEIAVISAFPSMLHDYYGENLYEKISIKDCQ